MAISWSPRRFHYYRRPPACLHISLQTSSRSMPAGAAFYAALSCTACTSATQNLMHEHHIHVLQALLKAWLPCDKTSSIRPCSTTRLALPQTMSALCWHTLGGPMHTPMYLLQSIKLPRLGPGRRSSTSVMTLSRQKSVQSCKTNRRPRLRCNCWSLLPHVFSPVQG